MFHAWKKLKEQFDVKYKAAAERFMRNKVDELKEAQPGKAYNVLKTMGARPGDCTDDHISSLPGHQELNLTEEQCAEKIAEHFAAISSEYDPINPSLLPERVKVKLSDTTNPPIISEYDTYAKLKSAKKPKSVIPGDLPNTIVKGENCILDGI